MLSIQTRRYRTRERYGEVGKKKKQQVVLVGHVESGWALVVKRAPRFGNRAKLELDPLFFNDNIAFVPFV